MTFAEMRDKLARKLFVGGEFYFKHDLWDSALVYFEDLLERHPDADVAPRALLRMVQIYTELGYDDDAEAARQRLLSEFPDSAAAREVRTSEMADGS